MIIERNKMLAGGWWVTITTLSTSTIGFITTVLLPKYIKPEEFGLFALGSLVVTVGQRIVSFG